MTKKVKVENVVHPRLLVYGMHAILIAWFALLGWCTFVTLKWLLF